jgi:hypothetical protein
LPFFIKKIQVQQVVAPLQLDDNATTIAPQSVRQQVEMPPLCQTPCDPVIRMMPTPGFVPHNTVHPSREDHVSPAPTTNHSPAHLLTSVSSRPTSLPSNLPPPIPAERANDGRPMIRPYGRGYGTNFY